MSAWPWPASDATEQIIPAFVKALQATDGVTKARKVNMGEGRASYSYADLSDVLDVVKPVLEAHGLAITQAAADNGVTTVLLHTSGEWLSWPPLTVRTGQNTPQAQGSAATYGRRYSILAALNIATEDDDGQAAAVQAPAPAVTAAEREAIKVFEAIKALDDEGKSDLKAWAAGQPLTVPVMRDNGEWREQVAGWLKNRPAVQTELVPA